MNLTGVYLTALLVLIVGIALLPYFLTFNGGFSNDSGTWSDFGSYVGGVLGPLFAMLSFLAVVFTLWTQGRQNSQQQFYSSLFPLMSMQREHAAKYKRKALEGLDAFSSLLADLEKSMEDPNNLSPTQIEQAYTSWSSDHDVRLRTYMTATTNLLGYICYSSEPTSVILRAFHIVLGNLSVDEITVLLFEVTLNEEHKWIRAELEARDFFYWGKTHILNWDDLWKKFPRDASII